MKRLSMVRGTASNLGKWMQIPHLVKSWQYDIEKDILIYHNKQECDIFRRKIETYTRRECISVYWKGGEYEYMTVPTTVSLQGYNPHRIEMQGFGEYVPSYGKEEFLNFPIKNDK